MENIITLTADLKESSKQIEIKILAALRSQMNARIVKAGSGVIKNVRSIITNAIKSQPEYDSLANGRLAGDFGFADGKNRIDAIIKYWVDRITLAVKKTRKTGNTLYVRLELRGMSSDYKEVIQLPEAVTITEKGQHLPWLEWLLTYGSSSIIADYDVYYAPIDRARSRSGRAIMINNVGEGWGVPGKFAGTPNDNFITRALSQHSAEIDAAISVAIRKEFK